MTSPAQTTAYIGSTIDLSQRLEHHLPPKMPKPRTVTARFNSLRRAVDESRKYGVTAQFHTIEHSINTKGIFLHYMTATRILSISRDSGRGRWKMAVDVQGRVKPAIVRGVSLPVVGRLYEEKRELTTMQQAFVDAVEVA